MLKKSTRSRGGKRDHAGRKRGPEPIIQHTVTLYQSHLAYLREIDPSVSQAIRKLIAQSQVNPKTE